MIPLQERRDRDLQMLNKTAFVDSTPNAPSKSANRQSPVMMPGAHLGDVSLSVGECNFSAKCVAGSQWTRRETVCLLLSCDTIRRSIAVDVFNFFQVSQSCHLKLLNAELCHPIVVV